MARQEQQRRSEREPEEPTPPPLPGPSGAQAKAAELDDLLGEIDTVLEANAEAFVKGFVQKGGQ